MSIYDRSIIDQYKKGELTMNKKLRGDLMLILAAMIWGSAFVAQKSGADLMGPIAFNGVRMLIGGNCTASGNKYNGPDQGRQNAGGEDGAAMPMTKEEKRAAWKNALKGGILCGLALATAGGLQQLGICYTTAGKAGFITALYVVIVPVFGLIFLRKKVRPVIWLCVIASAIGLYLLCIPAGGGFSNLNKGDMIMPICAIMFAIHILIIDNFSPKTDGVRLSCITVPDRRYRFALLHMAGSAYRIFPADTGCCALKLAAPDLHRRTFMRRGIHFPDNRAGRYRSDRRIDDTCPRICIRSDRRNAAARGKHGHTRDHRLCHHVRGDRSRTASGEA